MMKQGSVGLFLDPGLGKTSICLSAFKILKDKGLAKKMLIVAPLRPCYAVWPTEIEKWENFKSLKYVIVHGSAKEEALTLDADVYIINPEGLIWLFGNSKSVKLPSFDVLCVDESTKFKDTNTRRFKLLRPYIPKFTRRWILTGTPAPNGIRDLFGQVYILDMGHSLGKYITHFLNKYFYRSPYDVYSWLLQPGAFDQIIERIAPLVYQLNAEDYLKMPEMIKSSVYVDIPESARKVYTEIEDTFMTLLEEDPLIAANSAVAGGKCRQIANGAVYLEDGSYRILHDEKLAALEELLEELNGNPALVLYEFRHDLERLQKRFPDAVTIGSGTSLRTLEDTIRRFNAGEISVLFGHPASMGHGLNLQGACHHVIWFGIPWNLEHYDQTISRVYRQGQKAEHVYIYHIVAKNTKDEDVVAVLQSKGKVQTDVKDAVAKYRHGTMAAA